MTMWMMFPIIITDNTISNTLMMDVRNSHGKWEVPKPYLNGGSAGPACLLRNPDQLIFFLM